MGVGTAPRVLFSEVESTLRLQCMEIPNVDIISPLIPFAPYPFEEMRSGTHAQAYYWINYIIFLLTHPLLLDSIVPKRGTGGMSRIEIGSVKSYMKE